jgi:hypothetical protein
MLQILHLRPNDGSIQVTPAARIDTDGVEKEVHLTPRREPNTTSGSSTEKKTIPNYDLPGQVRQFKAIQYLPPRPVDENFFIRRGRNEISQLEPSTYSRQCFSPPFRHAYWSRTERSAPPMAKKSG